VIKFVATATDAKKQSFFGQAAEVFSFVSIAANGIPICHFCHFGSPVRG